MKKSKSWDWFVNRFMLGVTFFHIAGLALLLGGGQWGDKGTFNAGGFHFTVTLPEIAGFVTFFRELAKSWFSRRAEAKAPVEK